MRITVGQLRRIIKEELHAASNDRLNEGFFDSVKQFFGAKSPKEKALGVITLLRKFDQEFRETKSKITSKRKEDESYYDVLKRYFDDWTKESGYSWTSYALSTYFKSHNDIDEDKIRKLANDPKITPTKLHVGIVEAMGDFGNDISANEAKLTNLDRYPEVFSQLLKGLKEFEAWALKKEHGSGIERKEETESYNKFLDLPSDVRAWINKARDPEERKERMQQAFNYGKADARDDKESWTYDRSR